MDIRPVNIDDDQDFRGYYAALRSALQFERPDEPSWSEREAVVIFRSPDPSQKRTAYVAVEDGSVLGGAFTTLPLLDNVDKGSVQVGVPPEFRRRGVGAALLEHAVEACRAAGRTAILAEAVVPIAQRESHPYRRFAEKQGFSLANTELFRVLDLPVPAERLDSWSNEAAERHVGYRIETFVDEIPPELVEDYCFLDNQVALDAPTGDIDFEALGMTPESFAVARATTREHGATLFDSLALNPQGRAVAYTTLALSRDDPINASQWGTYVHRDHRGHRLGLAIKAANLRAMQTAHPERRRIRTSNAETNAPMVDINELIGFRPHELLTEFQLKL